MEFSVPQFVEVEDKIIGPLTLKQFLILLGGGLISIFLWRLAAKSGFFFLAALPVTGLSVLLAFGRFNGRPIMSNFASLISFYTSSKSRVFKHIDESEASAKQKPQEVEQMVDEAAIQESRSRLKKLAYLLDQKTAEEDRLIHSGEMPKTWLNKI